MTLKIEGMGCIHCVTKVQKALTEIGAEVRSCEIGTVEIAPFADVEKLRDTIESIGFDLLEVL